MALSWLQSATGEAYRLQSLWEADLSDADVCLVYGVPSMLGELGEKKKRKIKAKKAKAKRGKTIAGDDDEAAPPPRPPPLLLPRSSSSSSRSNGGKKLSRRARRTPRRLREQLALSASLAPPSPPSLPSPPLRLETHLWHAKRMAMGTPWKGGASGPSDPLAIALGAAGAGRGDRAAASAVRGRALAHDASYWLPLRLRGSQEAILGVLDAAAPGWRESGGVGDEEEKNEKTSGSKRRRKRRARRLGLAAAVLSGRAEADAVFVSVPCPVRIMFDSRSVEGEGSARACVLWVHAAAEVEARTLLSALIASSSSSSDSSSDPSEQLLSLDALPAPLRRLEVVGALADAVVVGAIGAAAATANGDDDDEEDDEDGSSRDARAWAALRAALRGNKARRGGAAPPPAPAAPPPKNSNSNNAFSSLSSGCALRIVASDPRLRGAPRESRAVIGGGARRVAAAAEAALGGKKKKEEEEEKKLESEQRPPPKKTSSSSRPRSLASSRVASCLSALKKKMRRRKENSKGSDDEDKLFSSSSSSSRPLPPLPTRTVSAVRRAARRAALGLLPLSRRTAREVEKGLASSPSSFATTFPLLAVRRFPPPPPRPRNGDSSSSSSPPSSSSSSPSTRQRQQPPRLPHWSIIVPEGGWALLVWRALVASKSGGVGGGGGIEAEKSKKKKSKSKTLRGKGVAVAGQREWRWASSICSNSPCLSPFFPDDWPEGGAASKVREEEEASAVAEDAKRPPGKKKIAKPKGEGALPLLPSSFSVARTWQQVQVALTPTAAAAEEEGAFVPAALWPERRGTLSPGSRVFLRPRSSSSVSRGAFIGMITTAPPRGCPPGVATAAGVLRARALWRERFGVKEKEKKEEKEEKKKEKKKTKKRKNNATSSSEASVRVFVVLPDGREVIARAAPSGVAASLW